jgi:hypothetical protein
LRLISRVFKLSSLATQISLTLQNAAAAKSKCLL